jgi:hypothetical protein
MLEAIITFIIFLLAAYGVYSLVVTVADCTSPVRGSRKAGVKLVLLVKNQEDSIEGIIRTVFSGEFLRKIMSGHGLTVLDLGSKDKTVLMLEKLQKDFDSLEVLKENEKERIFEGVES